MMKLNYKILLCLLALTASAFAYDINTKGFLNSNAIHGYDPVAYFTEQKPVKGNKEIAYEWQGAEWLFVSTQNRQLFIDTPDAYAPQYGGFCAYAMSRGEFVDIDPDAWTILDGKLYLNYSKGVEKTWKKKTEFYITAANEKWKKLFPQKKAPEAAPKK